MPNVNDGNQKWLTLGVSFCPKVGQSQPFPVLHPIDKHNATRMMSKYNFFIISNVQEFMFNK